MPSYPMDKQNMIVAADMCFHNLRIIQMIKILENVIGIRIMCQLYHQDIEDIMSPKMHEIHLLQKLMIELWINFEMILQEQSFFLDHNEHVCFCDWLIVT
jgi:hypothetical protein